MPPYRLQKLLTPRIFILECVIQLLYVDEVCIKSAHKNIHIIDPIAMWGYYFLSNKEALQVDIIFGEMNLYLEKSWMYDPKFVMAWMKGNKDREPNDHESRPAEEMLAKEHSWMEVMAIMEIDEDPDKSLAEGIHVRIIRGNLRSKMGLLRKII